MTIKIRHIAPSLTWQGGKNGRYFIEWRPYKGARPTLLITADRPYAAGEMAEAEERFRDDGSHFLHLSAPAEQVHEVELVLMDGLSKPQGQKGGASYRFDLDTSPAVWDVRHVQHVPATRDTATAIAALYPTKVDPTVRDLYWTGNGKQLGPGEMPLSAYLAYAAARQRREEPPRKMSLWEMLDEEGA